MTEKYFKEPTANKIYLNLMTGKYFKVPKLLLEIPY